MAKVRSRGNKSTEVRAVKLFRGNGCTGWRRGFSLFGNPDFVFPKHRLAVFIDGCFWHGCTSHCRMPSSNANYWQRKIARNRKRDRLVCRTLEGRNWRVIRIWEHELRHPQRLLRRLARTLRQPQPLQNY